MKAFHHRNCGLANFAFLSELPANGEFDGVRAPTVELIGDLLHVSPLALKAVIAARRVADVAFVTDAIAEPVPGKRLRCGGGPESEWWTGSARLVK